MRRLEKDVKEIKTRLKEEVRKRLSEKIEIDKIKERFESEIVNLKESVEELSKKVEFLENRERERKEVRSVKENIWDKREEFESVSVEEDSHSRVSISVTGHSRYSTMSRGLSERDVKITKKVVIERDKRGKEDNSNKRLESR